MRKEELQSLLTKTYQGMKESDVPAGVKFIKGKVRDVFEKNDSFVLSTTDRISAFDRVLTTIPCKGEILNRISLYWFKQTQDIIKNHILSEVTPRSVAVAKCKVLPIEVIVRGYLTGSAWRDYQNGKDISGIVLPKGMKNNQKFDNPLVTPSTKEDLGAHDQPISGADIVKQGLVEESLYKEVQETALALFSRGQEIAAKRGLILVDTKYEFGMLDGKLVLVDEVHTPDSSRYWFSDTYKELFEKEEPQRKIDKEYLRQWLIGKGFMGEGEAPVIPDEVKIEVASRYIQAFEIITGEVFKPESSDDEENKLCDFLR